MQLSSNISKLFRHIDKIKQIKERPQVINVVLTLTSNCTQNCPFCYVSKRKKGTLELEDIKNFIACVMPLSVDISGGEPTIVPYINELIYWLDEWNIKIGLITNGSRLENLEAEAIKKLSWLRVSINNYIDGFSKIYIPEIPENVKFGGQYIYHFGSPKPDKLKYKLDYFWEQNPRFEYIRVVEDVTSDLPIPEEFLKYNNGKYIIEHKIPRKEYRGICRLGYLKPVIEPDGAVFSCAGNVDPIERHKSTDDGYIGTIKEPEKLLKYKDIWVNCEYCSSQDKINFIEQILKDKVEHEEFI